VSHLPSLECLRNLVVTNFVVNSSVAAGHVNPDAKDSAVLRGQIIDLLARASSWWFGPTCRVSLDHLTQQCLPWSFISCFGVMRSRY